MNLFEIVGIIHIIFYSFFGLFYVVHHFIKGLRVVSKNEAVKIIDNALSLMNK